MMRKFLSHLIVFAVIGYLVMTALDVGLSRVASSSHYGATECWENLMKGRIDADCVILGSSRAMNHVSPSLLDSILGTHSYNLGIPGLHFQELKPLYQLLKTRNNVRSLFLLNIDYSSLSPLNPSVNHFQYYPWFHDREFRKSFFPLLGFSIPERFLPLYRYHTEGYDFFVCYEESLYRGWLGLEREFNRGIKSSQKFQFHVSPANESAFLDFLDTLKKDDIDLVFFFSPIHVDAYQLMPNPDEMMAYYDSLACERGIPLLEYTHMWISKDSSYFADGMHMNRKGAIIFTDSLANDLKRLEMSGLAKR